MDPPGKPADGAASAECGPYQDLESTSHLLQSARKGDARALNLLFERCLPPLRRWARGRLPRWTRDMLDTDDVVQDTLLQTLKRIDTFEPRREGALQAYLRQAVVNRVRDEIRRVGRRPLAEPLDADEIDHTVSPLDEAIGREAVERYEAALSRLKADDREAIIARIEMGYGYTQLAAALDKPSADAARMAVGRALLHLAEEMNCGT